MHTEEQRQYQREGGRGGSHRQVLVPHAGVHVIVRGALAATLVVPSKYIAMVTLTLKTVGSVWALYDLPVVVQLLLLP